MKERPIIFSGDMVRAILEGRKTQTRRVVKPQPDHVTTDGWGDDAVSRECYRWKACRVPVIEPHGEHTGWKDGQDLFEIPCPYGQPGDRLWVRETWSSHNGSDVVYRADSHSDNQQIAPWQPSIHMPRRASRILLEVTDIRVERVQDISREDALAEGIKTDVEFPMHPADTFRSLWDSINAKRGHGWDTNPWVWVVQFRVINAQEA